MSTGESFFLTQSDAGGVNEEGDLFATALVAAGDLNVDGFEDVMVGTPGKGLGSGAAFGLFGSEAGATSGSSITQADADEVNVAGDQFGAALGSGKFDDNLIDDLVVGAPGKAPGGGPASGAVFVFLGQAGGTFETGFLLAQADAGEVGVAGDQFGAVLGSGDFNGDVFEDLAVSAPEKDGSSGAVFIFPGNGDGTFGTGFMLTQTNAGEVNEAGDRFGAAMTVGDFNADRIDDLIVGAPGKAPGGGPRSGAVFVFLGTKSGLNLGFSITQTVARGGAGCIPNVPGGCVPGVNEEGDRFGEALGVADLNGDGIEELVVGAPGEDGSSGAVFIFPGSRLVERAFTTGYFITQGNARQANEAGDQFGAAVSGGTLTDDGFEQLAVGAPGEAGGAGAVFVFPGGPVETGSPTATGFLITQADAGGVNEAGDRFGAAVTIEDLNQDLGAELIVGAPGEDGNSGAVFIFPGVPLSPPAITGEDACREVTGIVRPAGPPGGPSQQPCTVTNEAGDQFGTAATSGDFNSDGFADAALGTPGKDGSSGAVFIFPGSLSAFNGLSTGFFITQADAGGVNEAGDQFGTAVAAGDFNGDGFVDLAVGAPGEDGSSGAVYIFPGSVNGLTCLVGLPCPTTIITGSVITQANAGGVNEAGDQFGAALVVGDFDGDGIDDLAVGAPGDMLGAANSGSVFVFSGSRITTGFQITQTDAGGANEAGDQFGAALAAGDIVDTAFADLIVGAPGQTISGAARAGRVFIFPGSAGGFTAGLFIDQTDAGETNEAGDEFGAAMVVGDFNGDFIRDLAVGAPGDEVLANPPEVDPLATAKAGSVFVFLGSAAPGKLGITEGPFQVITHANQTDPDLTDPSILEATVPLAAGDRFGAALAIGRFNDDLIDDLVVGATGKALRVAIDQKGGTVTVFPGSDGVTVADERLLDVPGITFGISFAQTGNGGLAEAGDQFGAVLAIGDFNGNMLDDLVVGAPGDALGTEPSTSGVALIYNEGEIRFLTRPF